MVAKCSAIARSGQRCQSAALPDSRYCWVHDPAKVEQRREASRKGGRNRGNRARAQKNLPDAMNANEMAGWLSVAFKQVLTGKLEPKVGTALATIAKALLEVHETTELEARLRELEARAGVAPHATRRSA